MTLQRGATLPPRTFGPISRTDIVRYQGASGDFNPIHHDEPFAQAAGFPTVFSVGMLQAGYLAAYCVDLLGPENVRRFRVRFHDQVWPGDVLTCSGSIADVEEPADGAGVLISLDLRVEREPGDVVASGSAVFAAASARTAATSSA
jgi:acyl dehydratase